MRYGDHSDRVIILTLNDIYRKVTIEELEFEVIGFSDFLKNSQEFLGVELNAEDYKKRLSQVLKRKPFWK